MPPAPQQALKRADALPEPLPAAAVANPARVGPDTNPTSAPHTPRAPIAHSSAPPVQTLQPPAPTHRPAPWPVPPPREKRVTKKRTAKLSPPSAETSAGAAEGHKSARSRPREGEARTGSGASSGKRERETASAVAERGSAAAAKALAWGARRHLTRAAFMVVRPPMPDRGCPSAGGALLTHVRCNLNLLHCSCGDCVWSGLTRGRCDRLGGAAASSCRSHARARGCSPTAGSGAFAARGSGLSLRGARRRRAWPRDSLRHAALPSLPD